MMSQTLVTLVLLAALCGSMSRTASGQSGEELLTNSSVIKLVRAGFREKTVISIIRTRLEAFDLSPERLIELKKRGVSERIILAMLARRGEGTIGGDDWDAADEEFFAAGRDDTRRGAASMGSDGTNIFGSSGGSRGRVSSRGRSGGSENDTETIGSATVRIVRPPAEQGGAAGSKLERMPTLTNEGVASLVEAGFSEGTIIRRIEQSPADFDLSPQKLGELRSRRVTERVIAAMRAAMGEEGETQHLSNPHY